MKYQTPVFILFVILIAVIFFLGGCASKQEIEQPRPFYELSDELETKLA